MYEIKITFIYCKIRHNFVGNVCTRIIMLWVLKLKVKLSGDIKAELLKLTKLKRFKKGFLKTYTPSVNNKNI